MKINTKIEGDKEIQAKIKLLGKKSSDGLKKAITQSVIYVEGRAKHTTAWENVTGRLRSSVTHEVKTVDDKHQGKVGTAVFYAPRLEFGTSRMPARPWLLPALKESRDQILKFLSNAIKAVKP